MSLNPPGWWYGAPTITNRLIAGMLHPAGKIYSWVTIRRFNTTSSWTAPIPVICVGNLTAGGTGKTPLARAVAKRLTEAGHKPAFLSRGYKGTIAQPTWVNTGSHTATDVGDEPLLLAQDNPTMIARNRADGVRAITETDRAIDVVIMDDGLQNPQLAKNLVIAVVDGERGFGNQRVIPAGPLRADLQTQLEWVDLVLINERSAARKTEPAAWRSRLNGPVGHMHIEAEKPPPEVLEKPVIAFCGIGNPNGFFETLRTNTITPVRKTIFNDHHVLSRAEVESLLKAADDHGAELITTEKDVARLDLRRTDHAELAKRVHALKIEMVFDEDTEAELKKRLAHLFVQHTKAPPR
ncbi:MAG: tetraacyldisaccharide 4'-kinase [Pseudomonadota bacterium]